ncbi:T9SS type A sorting domain-containing protein [Winogradskyella poriferorum]|uniref:T9SS type A sorting domain-containing protein n=1 Tax=Winogradskyella poriferorum TaxID=307627 RepID=UPI003D64CE92
MKKKLIGCFALICLFWVKVSAQETFKVMFYNLLNYPLEDAVPNREDDLEFILSDYQPDLFLVCELNNVTGANNVLNITRSAISSNYEMATYVSNTSDDTTGDQNDLQNQLYYDSTKFILEEELIVPTDLRDFNVYKLKVNTVDQATNPIELYVIVCHLKASSGTQNQLRRFNMVVELDDYLSTLPSDTNVLLGGDLNLYTASEPAFQLLLQDTNNITFADPVNRVGSWSNNPNFVDVFTQSTRTQNGLGGTTGGFDDRFDFILTSENMLGSTNINYEPGSYQVYGNNGLSACYNSAINSTACAIDGSEFSFAVRDALHNFSDHLPVTLNLEIDDSLLGLDEFGLENNMQLEASIIDSELKLMHVSNALFNEAYKITDIYGKVVKAGVLNSNSFQNIDCSSLVNGIYIISFKENSVNPLKFIVAD